MNTTMHQPRVAPAVSLASNGTATLRSATIPVPPGEQPLICCDRCSCTEQDGNANIIAVVDLPGASFAEPCFLKAHFESIAAGAVSPNSSAMAQKTGAMPPFTFGLRLSSVWAWHATHNPAAGVITITPPAADKLFFSVTPGSATARISGEARQYAFSLQLLDSRHQPCPEGEPAYWLLADAEGNRVCFAADSGEVISVRTAAGRLITAAELAEHVRIESDANGFIRSVYCATDGFLRTSLQPDTGALLCEWFTPSQVQVTLAKDGTTPLYETSGSPFRTESFRCTSTKGVQSVTITRRQGELPPHTTTRTQSEGLVSITRGSGRSAVVRSIRRAYLGNGEFESIETLHHPGEELTAPASCTRELMLRTQGGWLLTERTEGYGSPAAQTTVFDYGSNFRLAQLRHPDGSTTRYEYDSAGRPVLEVAPRVGGFKRLTRTTYANNSARFFDHRPLTETVSYTTAAGEEKIFSVLSHSYEDSDTVEKIASLFTAADAAAQPQLSERENWVEAAPYPYAAGKPKSSLDASGIRTIYDYTATSLHGACHLVRTTTVASDGSLVPAQSRRREYYIAADETLRYEAESVWNGGRWLLLATAAHEYDAQQRCTRTTRGNGRSSSTEWMCDGKLREVDEDGIATSYAYDSARQLVETIRSEVKDGDSVVTPETITTFTRDAAGRVLSTRRDIGPMSRVESAAYDLLGRVVRSTDSMGHTTSTAYSADGLTTTVTTPAGATFVSTRYPDGSPAARSGSGQSHVRYTYDMNGNNLRTTLRDAAAQIISQSVTNGLGQTIVETRATTTGFIHTRSEFDRFGRQIKSSRTTDRGTSKAATTLLEYDAFGNLTRQASALHTTPTKDTPPILELAYGVEELPDGIYATTTQIGYSAEGSPLVSVEKELISELSPVLESKKLTIDIRGMTSTEWSEYSYAAKRISYSSLPTSDHCAEMVRVDAFIVSQKDHSGATVHSARTYTTAGMRLTQSDDCGTTTTLTDIAGREISHSFHSPH